VAKAFQLEQELCTLKTMEAYFTFVQANAEKICLNLEETLPKLNGLRRPGGRISNDR